VNPEAAHRGEYAQTIARRAASHGKRFVGCLYRKEAHSTEDPLMR
jgi:hypothetical protein